MAEQFVVIGEKNTDISPHLASPVGEGLIHQDIDSPSTYRVTCISPTGENERGLK